MVTRRKKYQNKGKAGKTGILLLVLLLSGFLHAQVDDLPADTTIPLLEIDSTSMIVSPPEETDEELPVMDDEEDTGYFSPKWMYESGFDSLRLRRLNDNARRSMQDDEDFWYANAVFKKAKEKERKERDESTPRFDFFNGLLWMVIIGGFIAFLVIYLSHSNVRLFRSSRSIEKEESDVETDDIFTIPYQKEIDKAVGAGNYRLAVRLLFLRLLRQLSEKNMIQYTQDRTNFDYLLQVQHTPWYQHFFRLTRHYEYVWYGRFGIDRDKFDAIKSDFASFERQL